MGITDETRGGIEKFYEETMAARKVSPEIEALQHISLDVLKLKAKKQSISEFIKGLKAIEEKSGELDTMVSMKENVDEKLESAEKTLQTSVKAEIAKGGNAEEFIKVAKNTRFATSMKPIDAATFASHQPEVINRIRETINEQILRVSPEELSEMMKEETNDNVVRFVGMYQKRVVSPTISGWLKENVDNEEIVTRAIEHLEEMKGRLHVSHTLKPLITRWINHSVYLKDDSKTDDQKREFIEKSQEILMTHFRNEYKVI